MFAILAGFAYYAAIVQWNVCVDLYTHTCVCVYSSGQVTWPHCDCLFLNQITNGDFVESNVIE